MKSFAFASALVAGANAWSSYQPVVHQPVYHNYGAQAASKSQGASAMKDSASNWDSWGRDQDYSSNESYGSTKAKSYSAESYDEWDNDDADKWGAQAWGKDRDAYGASSYGKAASDSDSSYSNGDYYGAAGASATHGASKGAYDNDVWAKQAYGQDTDSRWGKSYDSVSAKSYDNEHYAKQVRADDDQWAEDYDRWNSRDADGYGKAASADAAYGSHAGYGSSYGNDASVHAASKSYGAGYDGSNSSNWDAWGRDQDYAEDISYDNTWAKSYDAESYDEWDNQDADKYGAQAWGSDKDVYGASSYGAAASEGKYAADSYGKGYGDHGYGGYEKGYGANKWEGASKEGSAQAAGYDNDQWAKTSSGSDFDSRWGKSYDSVSAKSYDNEEYARWVQADDNQWA